MLFWLLGLWSCKDFKSWESKYTHVLKIAFEPEKDPSVPKALKDLQSAKLFGLNFTKKPCKAPNESPLQLNCHSNSSPIEVDLKPDADAVSFELEDQNNTYYHKVTICYTRTVSLISPEAGGLQIQYRIKHIECSAQINKRHIFKRVTIKNFFPLEKEKAQPDVTLYY